MKKVMVEAYKKILRPSLLYASESWTATEENKKKVRH